MYNLSGRRALGCNRASRLAERRLLPAFVPTKEEAGAVTARMRKPAGLLATCMVVGSLLVTACDPAVAQEAASEADQPDLVQAPENEAGQPEEQAPASEAEP